MVKLLKQLALDAAQGVFFIALIALPVIFLVSIGFQ